MPVPAAGDSLDEGLPSTDHIESDCSADDASSDGGWSSDCDQGRDATDKNPTTFGPRLATLNVRGYQRKSTEVLTTALRHKVDVVALTETRSRAEGRVECEDYALWESGANRAEGKALRVHIGGQISVEPEAVTVGPHGAIPPEGRDPCRGCVRHPLQTRRRGPGRAQGRGAVAPRTLGAARRFQQRRATAPGVPGQTQNVGIHGLPHRVDVDVEGSGGHTHERFMIDFILPSSDM